MDFSGYLSYFKPMRFHWFALVVLILSCIVLGFQFVSGDISIPIVLSAGTMVTLSLVTFIGMSVSPDNIRAHQTDNMLKLSRQTLACLKNGLDEKSAQKICELLLSNVAASSVVLCDSDHVLGYAGKDFPAYHNGSEITTKATRETLIDGKERILYNADEIGFDASVTTIQAAIITPLMMGRRVVGTLAFYYKHSFSITATQQSIAEGFAQLVSTTLAAEAMEEQQRLATAMELKALQAQINPHFLFNTINTIASFVRTDPAKARTLLRDFAVFYRRTLDDSGPLIPFNREIEQTVRYCSFEIARFGEERLSIETDIVPEAQDLLVPPFLVQPLVENSIQHAMPSEGKLLVKIEARIAAENMIVKVIDNGIGMSKTACENILHPESHTGIGIAVKNVHDRMCGYFGPGTHMDVDSVEGEGTTITLFLDQSVIREIDSHEDVKGVFYNS